jgi:DNA polymerase-3 subunit delta'
MASCSAERQKLIMPFSSIIGHAAPVALLKRAVERGRVPQSLLFAGPDGVGKRTVAIALAQAVNCPRRADGDGCGVCPTCVRVARGQHSDVTFVSKGDEASIKIKTLRSRVLDVVTYRPFEAERRVYIIEPADAMTPEAQDALLKTLEEPPPAAIMILVTAYPDTLLATIQSRCRRLRFGPLADSDVVRVLVEHGKVDRALAQKLAATAGGSVGRALSQKSGDLDDDREAAMELLTAARAGAVAVRIQAATALAKHGTKRREREALSTRLAVVASLLRDLAAIGAASGAALANSDIEEELRALSPAFDVARVSAAFAAVHDADVALERNASPKIVADWIALTI